MAPSNPNPWIIRITLLVHFIVVCLLGLCYRGYLPEPQHILRPPWDAIVFVPGLLTLLVCPFMILVLAVMKPSRSTAYAVVVEVLLVYASAIALLPAVQ